MPPRPSQNARKVEFGRRLTAAISERGWSQSEFARETEKFTPKGSSKIGRDLVSKYCRGLNLPGPKHLTVLAKTLGTTPEELAPPQVSPEEYPRLAFQSRDDGTVWLQVNQQVPMELALQILNLLKENG